jgi:hypothetical protein
MKENKRKKSGISPPKKYFKKKGLERSQRVKKRSRVQMYPVRGGRGPV